jgi:hypothetical protein
MYKDFIIAYQSTRYVKKTNCEVDTFRKNAIKASLKEKESQCTLKPKFVWASEFKMALCSEDVASLVNDFMSNDSVNPNQLSEEFTNILFVAGQKSLKIKHAAKRKMDKAKVKSKPWFGNNLRQQKQI